jgi:hypothetical protein
MLIGVGIEVWGVIKIPNTFCEPFADAFSGELQSFVRVIFEASDPVIIRGTVALEWAHIFDPGLSDSLSHVTFGSRGCVRFDVSPRVMGNATVLLIEKLFQVVPVHEAHFSLKFFPAFTLGIFSPIIVGRNCLTSFGLTLTVGHITRFNLVFARQV